MKLRENHERNQIELSRILRENRLDQITGTEDARREELSRRKHFKIETVIVGRSYQVRRKDGESARESN